MSTTLLTLHIASPELSGLSWQIHLKEDWDTVFNRMYPLNPPASNLEHRENMWHYTIDGRRVAINPSIVAVVEEVQD